MNPYHPHPYPTSNPTHPPSYTYDPFRSWYRHQLSTLTTNSRPIIQNLSMAAMERRDKGDWGGMVGVGEEIEGAIERAPPYQKLPLWYLLDSIAKNVSSPYNDHIFPRFLTSTFLRSYSQVDGATKSNMESMLRTWRNGGVGGVDLFGREVREGIEAGIFGSQAGGFAGAGAGAGNGMGYGAGGGGPGYAGGYAAPPVQQFQQQQLQQQYGGRSTPTMPTTDPRFEADKAKAMGSLTMALRTKRAVLDRVPGDAEVRVHVGVLEQIEKLLHAGNVNAQELRDIQSQLDTILAESPAPTPSSGMIPAPTPQPYSQHQHRSTPEMSYPHQQQQQQGYIGYPPQQQRNPLPGSSHLAPPPMQQSGTRGGTPLGTGRATPQPAAAMPAGPPGIKMDFGSLLRDLTAAGVISNASTPVHNGNGSAASTPPISKAALLRAGREGSMTSQGSAGGRSSDMGAGAGEGGFMEGDEQDGMLEYEEMILAMNVSLSISDLTKDYNFGPVAHLPNRCSQCAARFPAGPTGKARLQAHLDWHFRRNRKERESEGRGANRRWLPRAEAWIKDIVSASAAIDRAEPSSATRPAHGLAPKVDVAAQAKRQEELRNSWIPVPTNPAKASQPCPICKEQFVSEYNEDEEEWIWKNAVEVDVQAFHATCRADTVASAVAVKSTTDNASKSANIKRTHTPQSSITQPIKPTASPGAGPSTLPAGDIKPSAASLQAADRLSSSLGHRREGSASSINTASGGGVKRKADGEPIDGAKDVKREKP